MADRLKERGTTFFHRQSPEYIKELIAAYPDNLKMTLLYLNDDVIGAKLDCIYKGFYMGWCGGTEIDNNVDPNEFFEWETIKLAKSLGCDWYENWGGDMRRLNPFKAKLNPALVPYYHITKKDTVGKLSDWGYDMISGNPYLEFVKKMIA
jgi:lipid II:glycine glycyltransferase (peptidoglycan interpeptide bridge formation enzyme)